MKKYHKIDTIFHRDPNTNHKTLINGQFSRREFEYLQDCTWIGTEKIDGTNIRSIWYPPTFVGDSCAVNFRGKTDNAQIPPFLDHKLKSLITINRFKEIWPEKQVTLYGEGYGDKIQKMGKRYIPDDCGFILFDVQIDGLWLARGSVEDIARGLGLKAVPVVFTGPLWKAVEFVANGFDSQVAKEPGTSAEGLVLRPEIELTDRMGRRIITKIKTKDFWVNR
jgi:hypothetical protein